MKIYKTDIFEKLKIRSVDIKTLHNETPSHVKMVDAGSIKFSDLKPGYIVKTKEPEQYCNPFYLLLDIGTYEKLRNRTFNFDYKFVLMQYKSVDPYDLTYLYANRYMDNFPCHDSDPEYDMDKVYITDCDVSNIKTKKDFIEIYNKYIQYIRML